MARCGVGLALLGAWRLKADAKLLSVFGLAAITMPLALAILSIFTPFWITRYLLWSTGPFFVLADLDWPTITADGPGCCDGAGGRGIHQSGAVLPIRD